MCAVVCAAEYLYIAQVGEKEPSSSPTCPELEALSQPTTKKKKFNHFSLSEAKLLARLIHEHDTNYKVLINGVSKKYLFIILLYVVPFSLQKMARDKFNVFQLTEAQLRRKCMDLQRSSFSYLLEDEDSVMEKEEEGRED